jgi:hypothetical protein
MQDEQVNQRRKEKIVIEQDTEIAIPAAKRTYAHVNEAPDPPRPQKRVRSGLLADRTLQLGKLRPQNDKLNIKRTLI